MVIEKKIPFLEKKKKLTKVGQLFLKWYCLVGRTLCNFELGDYQSLK